MSGYFRCYFIVLLLIFSQTSLASTTYKVKNTDNLSVIVDKFYKSSDLSRYQIFIAILAENPEAFRFGNINHLKNGQMLNLPDSKKLLAMEALDAANLVAEHNDNASEGLKVKIAPPFKDYSPKKISIENSFPEIKNNNKSVAIKQQASQEELDKLSSESEALRSRLEQLIADKEAMDAELIQLDELIKQK